MSRPPDPGDPRLDRLTAQYLAGPPAGSVEEVVDRLLGVQAQDERGFRLAVRGRTRDLVADDVDRALTERRSLVVTWLQRGTLHLVRSEDYWWLHPLTAPRVVTGNDRRLRQLGVGEAQVERAVDTITAALAAEGPRTRRQLRDHLDAAGVPTAGQALVHLLAAASLRGLVVRGPVVAGEHAYVSVPEWLGPAPTPPGRPDALARLARRYLLGHAPASDRDLAKWAGITLGDARLGLRSFAGQLVEGPAGVALASTRPSTGPFPPPGCWAPSTPCCTDGCPGRRSSASDPGWSRPTASSGRWPWPGGGWWPPGRCPGGW